MGSWCRTLLTCARPVLISICGALALASPGGAQARGGLPSHVTASDTSIYERWLPFVVERITGNIARASQDTMQRPWQIELPSTAPPWPAFERHLRVMLRARPVTPADSQYHVLTIGPLQGAGDTLHITVQVGETRLCPTPDPRLGPSGKRGGHVASLGATLIRVRRAGFSIWTIEPEQAAAAGDALGCDLVRY